LLDPAPGAIDVEDDELYLRIQTTFAAAISYFDVALGELLQVLREHPGDEPVLLVTSDRGQALGERGTVGDGALHEEIIHVPLLLYGAGAESRRVAALTQAVDLAPTMAELFGVAWLASDGRSLLPLVRGESVPWRDEALCGQVTERGVEWGLRTAEWFFRLAPTPEGPKAALFVKPDDRLEVNDVVQQQIGPAEELERRSRQRVGLGEAAT
jgi:arylsulfatase A-like enzyme